MDKGRRRLTDKQWKKIEALLPKPKPSKKGGDPGRIIARCLKAFYGSFVPALPGPICPNDIPALQLVGDD